MAIFFFVMFINFKYKFINLYVLFIKFVSFNKKFVNFYVVFFDKVYT